jgi:hypothetical protein
MTKKLDAAWFRKAIEFRHRGKGTVLIKELRIGCGYVGAADRAIDVWAIEPNASKGCTAVSYEIKCSRSDFLKDMKDPLKQRGARLFSDQFYFVAPRGMLCAAEIPDWAGLLEPYENATDEWPYLTAAVAAPMRSKDAPSWPLVVSMLRREAIILPEVVA